MTMSTHHSVVQVRQSIKSFDRLYILKMISFDSSAPRARIQPTISWRVKYSFHPKDIYTKQRSVEKASEAIGPHGNGDQGNSVVLNGVDGSNIAC